MNCLKVYVCIALASLAQLVGVLSQAAKGQRFDHQSWYIPSSGFDPRLGQEAIDQCFSLESMFLSPPFLFLKLIKTYTWVWIFFFFKSIMSPSHLSIPLLGQVIYCMLVVFRELHDSSQTLLVFSMALAQILAEWVHDLMNHWHS